MPDQLSEEFGPLRKGGAAMEVLDTPEFQRVKNLPRRVWQDAPDLPKVIAALNKYLHTYPGPCADPERCEGCLMRAGLRPAQAAALRDMFERPGAFLPIRPGGGKKAVSLLGFTLVKAQRPLLLVPADLQDEYWRSKRDLARHYRVLPTIEIASYQWLSHKNQCDFMDEYRPDVIFCDEADILGNTDSIAWKRLKKYLKANPATKFYVASGSFFGRRVREIAHLLRWTLRDAAPIQRDMNEQIAMGWAIDAKVSGDRCHPGALLTLPGATGTTELARGRRGFRTRIVETPGVISTAEDVPPMPLVIRSIEPAVPSALREAILQMRKTWTTPAGDMFKYALEMWGHAKRLGLGMHYYYDPPPPYDWKQAKYEWLSWALPKVKRMTSIDQLSQLQDKVLAGEIDDEGRYRRWLAVADTYDPDAHKKTHWVDDTTSIDWAGEWARKAKRGLIWTPDTAWGEKASERLGIPYFRELGRAKDGTAITDYYGDLAIVSIASCSRGRNLQRWSKNLVMNPPSVGKVWKQLVSRTWRDGQTAAAVEVDVILTSRESYSSIIQAIQDATAAADSMDGAHPLLLAQRHLPSVEELAMREDALWRTDLDLGV